MTSSNNDHIWIMIMSQHNNIILLYFQSHLIVFAVLSVGKFSIIDLKKKSTFCPHTTGLKAKGVNKIRR